MEATPMKLVGAIGTAFLTLTLGVAAPAYAQQDQQHDKEEARPEQQGENKAQPEKPAMQEEKGAQQQKDAKPAETNAKQEDKNIKPADKNAQPQERAANNGGGRIPADRFKANFGQQHSFRVTQADYSNHRFQYGGYSFGFVDPWPSNWLYTQNVYVVDINGVYYLCNPMYPGVNLALSFTL
jgi:hypothetical protein